jgi:hypothetical protein
LITVVVDFDPSGVFVWENRLDTEFCRKGEGDTDDSIFGAIFSRFLFGLPALNVDGVFAEEFVCGTAAGDAGEKSLNGLLASFLPEFIDSLILSLSVQRSFKSKCFHVKAVF